MTKVCLKGIMSSRQLLEGDSQVLTKIIKHHLKPLWRYRSLWAGFGYKKFAAKILLSFHEVYLM